MARDKAKAVQKIQTGLAVLLTKAIGSAYREVFSVVAVAFWMFAGGCVWMLMSPRITRSRRWGASLARFEQVCNQQDSGPG